MGHISTAFTKIADPYELIGRLKERIEELEAEVERLQKIRVPTIHQELGEPAEHWDGRYRGHCEAIAAYRRLVHPRVPKRLREQSSRLVPEGLR